MTRNFCTYFDKNYLLKGLALHGSLLEFCPNFHLWILCFDDESHDALKKLNLLKTSLIKLSDFEDEKLLAVKSGRKISEYCWTCTPSLPLYIFKQNPDLEMLAYLDADLYFYNSPNEIYEEFGHNSIMIIPHNFSKDQKFREKTSGIYNVGMLIFKNDANALECLNWWRDKCLEWCFDYYEDGKFGDQLYLNDWLKRIKGVHVLKNPGANVASWNIRNYDSSKWPLIFYHFHGIRLFNVFGKIKAKNQNINGIENKFIFTKYSQTLTNCLHNIKKIDKNFNCRTESNIKYLFWIIKYFLQRIKSVLSLFNIFLLIKI